MRKIREHAKTVASLLRQSGVSRNLDSVWCEELVILPYEDSQLVDADGKDDRNTVLLKDLVPHLTSHRLPGRRPVMGISALHEKIAAALDAVYRPPPGPRRFGIYEAFETLAEAETGSGEVEDADRVSVYRAVRSDQPNSGTFLVQVHSVDPLLPQEEHTRARERIGNPLQAINRLPPSRNIVPCVDVVQLADEAGYAVVLKDVQAEALRVRMAGGAGRPALGADAKRRVVSGVLAALAVAHGYRVVHRHITPDTVLVARNGTAMITGFDYAHTGRVREGTLAMDAYQRHDAAYLAPECLSGPTGFSRASDIYAAGVLFHELFTGELPTVTGGNRLVDSLDEATGIAPGTRDLIRRLLSADPAERPDAPTAVAELEELSRAGSGGAGGVVAGPVAQGARHPQESPQSPSTGRIHTATTTSRRASGSPRSSTYARNWAGAASASSTRSSTRWTTPMRS